MACITKGLQSQTIIYVCQFAYLQKPLYSSSTWKNQLENIEKKDIAKNDETLHSNFIAIRWLEDIFDGTEICWRMLRAMRMSAWCVPEVFVMQFAFNEMSNSIDNF